MPNISIEQSPAADYGPGAPPADTVSLSKDAGAHIRAALDKRGHGLGVRLKVKKAGCSGYEYIVEFADAEETMDHQFDSVGVRVYVDPKSLVLLRGTRLDYVRQGLNKGFVFDNPNEKSRCGCGESFSI